MSGIALVWAANVRGLKPHAKIVLIQLSDFHNKETGRCFPSSSRLADECEMSRSTVFRHLKTLEDLGLISRHSRGADGGGRSSNQYELHLDIVLGPSATHRQRSQIDTRAKVAETHGKGRTADTTLVSESDSNLNNEPGSNHSVPNGTDGGAVDFTKEVFDMGVVFLGRYDVPQRQARSLIGKWRKVAGETETLNALRDASRAGVTDPVAWITDRLKPDTTISDIFAKRRAKNAT